MGGQEEALGWVKRPKLGSWEEEKDKKSIDFIENIPFLSRLNNLILHWILGNRDSKNKIIFHRGYPISNRRKISRCRLMINQLIDFLNLQSFLRYQGV